MRIAFCIFKYFPHGGIQRDLLKICHACRSRGMRVRIYTIQWLAELPPDADLRIVGTRAGKTANPTDRSLGCLRGGIGHRRRGHEKTRATDRSLGCLQNETGHRRRGHEKTSAADRPLASPDHAASTSGRHCAGPSPDIEICVTPVRALSRHRLYERFAKRVREDLDNRPVALVVGMNKMPGLDVYYAGDSCYREKARAQRGFLHRLLPRHRSLLGSERAVFDPLGHTEILTISPVQTPIFQRHYRTPRERFHPLPPGIERDRAAPSNRRAARARVRGELGLAESERLLLFIGSGFVTKGLIRVLRGMGALPRNLLDETRLYVLGQDKVGYFERTARRLGLADRVRFLGGRDDVPDFLLAGDGLVLPALDEMAGLVILEAMIAGLPALVTENCGYAGYLRDAGAGLITPAPFRQGVFNAQLVELLTSEERGRWSRNGRAVANDANIYRMAPTAADLIKRFARARNVRSADKPQKSPKRAATVGDAATASSSRIGVSTVAQPTADKNPLYLRAGFEGPRSVPKLLAWAETVEGEVYRLAHGRRTQRVLLGGKPYFLKFHSGVGWLEILKNHMVGKRPVLGAENEYQACRHLERHGIRAPRVAAFAAAHGSPAARRSLILCDELAGFISLETIVGQWDATPPDPATLRRLVLAVAAFVRNLHRAGLVHRDLYLCHLWLGTDAWAAGEARLAVLDLHRARILTPMPAYWRKRDLAALLFSALDAPLHRNAWLRFVRVYSGLPLREAFAKDGSFWRSVYRRAVKLYGKGSRKGLVKGHFSGYGSDESAKSTDRIARPQVDEDAYRTR